VGLEESVDLIAAHRRVARKAGCFQRFAKSDAVAIGLSQRLAQVVNPSEGARGQRAAEAHAFFVGPYNDLHRCPGADVMVIQGANYFEPGQHAVNAIELAAERLGVQMTAGHYRRRIRIFAGALRNNVADLVHPHFALRLLAPGNEQLSRLAIQVGQRKSSDATPRRCADLAHLHDTRPQAIAVAAKHVDFSHL
jgi:hypothetical protein